MSEKEVFVYFSYDGESPSPGLEEANKSRSGSIFAALAASGWPGKGETRMFWNNTFRTG